MDPQICSKCHADPQAHSFYLLKQKKNGEYVYYTCPAKAKLHDDTEGFIIHLRNTLQQTYPAKWQWIIDAEDFGLKHAMQYNTILEIIKLIRGEFGESLQGIHVVNNSTILLNGVVEFAKPFMSDRMRDLIHIC